MHRKERVCVCPCPSRVRARVRARVRVRVRARVRARVRVRTVFVFVSFGHPGPCRVQIPIVHADFEGAGVGHNMLVNWPVEFSNVEDSYSRL